MPVMSTLGFRSVAGNALQWREVWWHQSDSPIDISNAWTAPRAGGKSVAQLRQSFLSKSAEIYYLKCTFFTPGAPKNTIVRRLFPPLRGSATESDYLGVSVSISLQIPGHRRSVSIRGIPDTWVEDNALTTAGNAGIKKILSGTLQANGKIVAAGIGYFSAIQEFLSGGIYADSSAATVIGSNITNGAGGLVNITVTPAFFATVSVGMEVVVLESPTMPLLASRWVVSAKDDTDPIITLRGSGQFRAVPGATCKVKLGSRAILVEPWVTNVVGVRTRDTGRPTDGPRGRRSARIRHR